MDTPVSNDPDVLRAELREVQAELTKMQNLNISLVDQQSRLQTFHGTLDLLYLIHDINRSLRPAHFTQVGMRLFEFKPQDIAESGLPMGCDRVIYHEIQRDCQIHLSFITNCFTVLRPNWDGMNFHAALSGIEMTDRNRVWDPLTTPPTRENAAEVRTLNTYLRKMLAILHNQG